MSEQPRLSDNYVATAVMENRLTVVEKGVADLQKSFTTSHNDLSKQLSELASTFSNSAISSSQTDWKSIVAIATLAIVVIGAYMSLIIVPITSSINRIESQEVTRIEHQLLSKQVDKLMSDVYSPAFAPVNK